MNILLFQTRLSFRLPVDGKPQKERAPHNATSVRSKPEFAGTGVGLSLTPLLHRLSKGRKSCPISTDCFLGWLGRTGYGCRHPEGRKYGFLCILAMELPGNSGNCNNCCYIPPDNHEHRSHVDVFFDGGYRLVLTSGIKHESSPFRSRPIRYTHIFPQILVFLSELA